MNTYRITLLSGDGIGPPAAEAAADLLTLLGRQYGFTCQLERRPFGRSTFLEQDTPLPEETVQSILASDAAFAAGVDARDVTGPTPVGLLRKKLGLYADVRPVQARPGRWALREDLDLVIVREITQGFLSDRNLHAGNGEWMSNENTAFSLRVISYEASRRIADFTFDYAQAQGRRSVTAIHKASIFKLTCGTFLRACRDAAAAHPAIAYREEAADDAAGGLVAHPERYDVVLCTNLFGDLLSDEAAALVSSLAPGVNVGPSARVYLPVTHSPAYEALARDSWDPFPALVNLELLVQELGEAAAARALSRAIGQALIRPAAGTAALLAQVQQLLAATGEEALP